MCYACEFSNDFIQRKMQTYFNKKNCGFFRFIFSPWNAMRCELFVKSQHHKLEKWSVKHSIQHFYGRLCLLNQTYRHSEKKTFERKEMMRKWIIIFSFGLSFDTVTENHYLCVYWCIYECVFGRFQWKNSNNLPLFVIVVLDVQCVLYWIKQTMWRMVILRLHKPNRRKTFHFETFNFWM